jgi:26S proteasome regulatory subunit N9
MYGVLEGTKTDMDTAWKTLNRLEGVETAVNASYYNVAADYYKARIFENATVHLVDLPKTGQSRICAVL